MPRVPHIVLLLSLATLAQVAAAQAPCTAPSPECVVVGDWNISVGVGLGQRSNPVLNNADIPLILIPQISYYGERFFLENLELGYTLYESDAQTFSILATPGYDRVFFYRNDLQNILVSVPFSGGLGVVSEPLALPFPIARRRSTYMAGAEWTFNYGPVAGQVNGLHEITGRHDGYEVRAAIAAPVVQRHDDSLALSMGFTWKSSQLVDYYYGVAPLYEADAALNPFLKLGYSRKLSARWTLGAFAHYEWLDDSIADSPIVVDDRVVTVFAGFMFKIL